ncbi:MAG TPA: hypothetical protein VK886_19710 [Vicinamibacterales bacterium]|nr:hypothetical protein [Vicinamibacterales bacterium]
MKRRSSSPPSRPLPPPPPSPPPPAPLPLADFPPDVRWQVGVYET